MRFFVAALMAASLAACTSSPPEATPDQKMRVLAHHLATAETPADWRLVRFRLRGGDGFIDANLGPTARLDALAIDPRVRFDYFSTPCPDSSSPTWSVFRSHENVFLSINIEGRRRFLVSCRTHN